jgi:hypothetical protein
MKKIAKTYVIAGAILTTASVSYLAASPSHRRPAVPTSEVVSFGGNPFPCGLPGIPPCPTGQEKTAPTTDPGKSPAKSPAKEPVGK